MALTEMTKVKMTDKDLNEALYGGLGGLGR